MPLHAGTVGSAVYRQNMASMMQSNAVSLRLCFHCALHCMLADQCACMQCMAIQPACAVMLHISCSHAQVSCFSHFSLKLCISKQNCVALFLFFFLIWGGTRSLCMPVLRPASQAGPMLNPREGTSVVLRDTIRLT